jgi:hypothetical protein
MRLSVIIWIECDPYALVPSSRQSRDSGSVVPQYVSFTRPSLLKSTGALRVAGLSLRSALRRRQSSRSERIVWSERWSRTFSSLSGATDGRSSRE